jgi:hypothetical protein
MAAFLFASIASIDKEGMSLTNFSNNWDLAASLSAFIGRIWWKFLSADIRLAARTNA